MGIGISLIPKFTKQLIIIIGYYRFYITILIENFINEKKRNLNFIIVSIKILFIILYIVNLTDLPPFYVPRGNLV